VVRRDAAVAPHRIAQKAARAVQPYVKVARRDAQRARDGRSLFTIDVDAPEHLGIGGPDLAEQPQAAPARRALRDAVVVAGELARIGVGGVAHGIAAPLAVVVHQGVAQDPVEPGAGAGGILEGPGPLRRAHQGALHDVVGVGLARDARPDQAHEARALGLQAFGESARFHGSYRASFVFFVQLHELPQWQGVQGQPGPQGHPGVAAGRGVSVLDVLMVVSRWW
jgi:hypothetical protein